jgi:hypothetical protein
MIAQASPRDSISASSRGFGNGIAAVGNIARPPEAQPVRVAAVRPAVRRRPALTPAVSAPADPAPDGIAAIIIASNGW